MGGFSSDEVWKKLAEVEVAAGKAAAARNKERSAQQVDHWSHAVLLERARYLRKMAEAGEGEAGETIREYPLHKANLLVRVRNGPAEIHESQTDIYIVLAGKATQVTGGTVVNPRIVGEGETRGDRVEGGQSQQLNAGDVIHIPSGVPHQTLVSQDTPFACIVLKVDQPEQEEESR